MILNASKTQSMLVTGKCLPSQLTDCKLDIRVNGSQIEQIHTKKLLGIIIDDQLTFDDHVDYLCKKLARRIGVLRKIRAYLPLRERIQYNATIKPVHDALR